MKKYHLAMHENLTTEIQDIKLYKTVGFYNELKLMERNIFEFGDTAINYLLATVKIKKLNDENTKVLYTVRHDNGFETYELMTVTEMLEMIEE